MGDRLGFINWSLPTCSLFCLILCVLKMANEQNILLSSSFRMLPLTAWYLTFFYSNKTWLVGLNAYIGGEGLICVCLIKVVVC